MREIVRGFLAGAAGTATMTGWQALLRRVQGSNESGDGEEQPVSDEERWEQASSPAQAARVVLRGVGFDPPVSWIPFLPNAVHWGLPDRLGRRLLRWLRRRIAAHPLVEGLAFGLGYGQRRTPSSCRSASTRRRSSTRLRGLRRKSRTMRLRRPRHGRVPDARLLREL
jgi:hypothetical protein